MFCQSDEAHKKDQNKTKHNYKTYKLKIMKTQTANLFSQISKEQVEKLTKEVKETLVTGYQHNQQKTTFSAADLWNIQRRSKSNNHRTRFSF